MTTYRGWIPNVAGRLSFSMAGFSTHPSRVIFAGDLEDAGSHFIGFQRRNLSDTSIPFISEWIWLRRLVDRWLLNKSGDFVFLCLMHHRREADALAGKVFCFARSVWSAARPHVRSEMDTLTRDITPDLKLAERLEPKIEKHFIASGRFSVARGGAFELDLEKLPDTKMAVGFSDLEQAFASQFHFFIRDLLHNHRFHAPTTDKILNVYKNEDWKAQVAGCKAAVLISQA